MNEQQTGTDRPHSSGWVWSERIVAAIVGGVLTSAALLWTSERAMDAREFQIRTERETAVRNLQGQLLDILVGSKLSERQDFDKVAFLGALHGNFSEQFDTRIVFEAYAEDVHHPVARRELRRLAQSVSRRQSQYIQAHGGEIKQCHLDWAPKKGASAIKEIEIAGHHLLLSLAYEPIRKWSSKLEFKKSVDEFYKKNDDEIVPQEFIKRQLDESDDTSVDDVADTVTLSLKMGHDEGSNFLTDLFTHESAESDKCEESKESKESNEKNSFSDKSFELSYMDSPYIDNMWIRHEDGSDDRIAVLLRDIDNNCPKENEDCGDYRVEIEILHFPDDLLLPVERPPPEEVVSGSHRH